MSGPYSVEDMYAQAKRGDWEAVLTVWRQGPSFAQECAHYAKPSSGWTFLHQAAWFGDERACRELIRVGARISAVARDGRSPTDVASARGHREIAALLRCAAAGSGHRLWDAPADAGLLPSSSLWQEARERQALVDMYIAYGGGRVEIRAGDRYFVDSFERVLVGWHGSYNPPCDMGGYPMIPSREGDSP